jgi:hypothetical protein
MKSGFEIHNLLVNINHTWHRHPEMSSAFVIGPKELNKAGWILEDFQHSKQAVCGNLAYASQTADYE